MFWMVGFRDDFEWLEPEVEKKLMEKVLFMTKIHENPFLTNEDYDILLNTLESEE